MRPAPGTGRRPTTPARPRPSCSCASSVRPSAHEPASPAAMLPMLARSPAFFRPTRAAPRRARRFSNSRRRSRFGLALPPRLRITPADRRARALGRHRLARHLRRARRRRARAERAGRDPRRTCSTISFPASPSRASTPRRSTIISTPALRPSVVLMNPPFSVVANVDGAAWRTPPCGMSLRRWRGSADGGRLVAITGASFSPDHPAWRDAFVRLQERGRVVFSAGDRRARSMPGTARRSRRG